MTRNMNNVDRIVRTGLGIALVAVALTADLAVIPTVVLYALAAIMLGTAAVGSCPLYSALGISTCPTPHRTRTPRARVDTSRSH